MLPAGQAGKNNPAREREQECELKNAAQLLVDRHGQVQRESGGGGTPEPREERNVSAVL